MGRGFKPNHKCVICGEEYYSCDYCSRIASWRRFCDTEECYKKLMEKQDPVKEQRFDKTDREIQELMNKPVEVVKAETEKELSDYADIIADSGIMGAVDEINKEIKGSKSPNNLTEKGN